MPPDFILDLSQSLGEEPDKSDEAEDHETYELETIEESHPPPLMPELQQRPLDQDIYCLNCGYNLRGIVGQCPECGQRFLTNRKATYSLAPKPGSAVKIYYARWQLWTHANPRKFHAILFLLSLSIGLPALPILCISILGYSLWLYWLIFCAFRATEDYTNHLVERISLGALIGIAVFLIPIAYNGIADILSILLIIMGAISGAFAAYFADIFQT